MTEAEIWCALNRFQWPEELGPKPDGDGAIWERMSEISTRIGMKECLREWNKGWMSDEEFEAWWSKANHSPKWLDKG